MSDRKAKPLTIDVAEASGTHVGAPPKLARQLTEMGAEARVVSHDALLHSQADAIVLCGNAPGALALLRSFRDDAERPATPVVMLGTPEGTGPAIEGPGFGAELILPMDASPRRVLEGLRNVIARQAPLPPEERGPERTLELSRVGEWRPAGLPGGKDFVPVREVSVVIAAEKSAVFASDADVPGARDGGSAPRERRRATSSQDLVLSPGTGSSPGSTPGSSPGTGAGTGTSQLLSFAPISDALRQLLYEGDRRMFPNKPPIDVSLPRGEEQAMQLIPDEFLEVVPLAFDEPDRNEADLTFVGVGAPRVEEPLRARVHSEAPRPTPQGGLTRPPSLPPPQEEEERIPRTSPGTPTSMSRRPPEAFETRSRVDGPEPKPLLGLLAPPSVPPPSVAPSLPPPKSIPNAGEIEPLGAIAVAAMISRGRLDATLMLRIDRKPAGLKFSRGELVGTSGEGLRELRRTTLHRLLEAQLGKGRAVEAVQGEPTFVTQRAARMADEQALGELLVRAEGTYSVSANDSRIDAVTRLTQRPFLPTLFELAKTHVKNDAVERFFGLGPALTASTPFLRLSRIALSPEPSLESLLGLVEAPRELGWLLQTETATEPTSLGALLARAPSEAGLVGAIFVLVQLGALSARTTDAMPSSLAHTDLDVQAEQAIRLMRDRADRADYFQILGLARDCEGHAVDEALARLTRELLAWPLADLGLSRLEPDRLRILSTLREAHEVLTETRHRRVYATALGTYSEHHSR